MTRFLIFLHHPRPQRSICHDQQQFCLHTTFNVLVILAQSAHRGCSPCGSPTWQHGKPSLLNVPDRSLGQNRRFLLSLSHRTSHCLLIQILFFLSSESIKIDGGVEVSVPYSVSSPGEFLLFIWSPNRGEGWWAGLVCCVWTGPGALIPARSYRCPAAPTQTVTMTRNNLYLETTENHKTSFPSTTGDPYMAQNKPGNVVSYELFLLKSEWNSTWLLRVAFSAI